MKRICAFFCLALTLLMCLTAAAEEWLQKNPQKLQPRFDVIEIYAPDGVDTIKPDIRHWENAFTLD